MTGLTCTTTLRIEKYLRVVQGMDGCIIDDSINQANVAYVCAMYDGRGAEYAADEASAKLIRELLHRDADMHTKSTIRRDVRDIIEEQEAEV